MRQINLLMNGKTGGAATVLVIAQVYLRTGRQHISFVYSLIFVARSCYCDFGQSLENKV